MDAIKDFNQFHKNLIAEGYKITSFKASESFTAFYISDNDHGIFKRGCSHHTKNDSHLNFCQPFFIKKDDPTPLPRAIMRGDYHATKFLLDSGYSPDMTPDEIEPNLILAIKKRKMKIFIQLMKHHPNLELADKHGVTPLLYALRHKLFRVAEILIRYGANVNFSLLYYGTPLIAAISANHSKMIKLLIEMGADVNQACGDSPPLFFAVGWEKIEAVKILLQHGAHVNLDDPPLYVARSVEIAGLLLDAGANINDTGKYGETILCRAAKMGHLSLVKYLLERGSDPTIKEGSAESAIDFVRRSGNEGLIKAVECYL